MTLSATDRLLVLLYDRPGGFFDLSELAAATKLGRRRLDEALGKLADSGCTLEFSPARGVRLGRPVQPAACLIEHKLETRRVGRSVLCFQEVGSTNDVAWDSCRSANQASSDGLVVLAEHQRAGRGRFARKWLSPPGRNVLMSVLMADDDGLLAHDAVTIAAGLAVAEGVEASCGLACELKWPNDVVLRGAKVAGVLVEMKALRGVRRFVIGIGINANASPQAGEVAAPAACLADHVGRPVERVEVVRAVLRRLDDWIGLIEERRLDLLHAAWLGRCGMLNERITVRSQGQSVTGTVLDVAPLEGLILRLDDGRTRHFPAESSSLV